MSGQRDAETSNEPRLQHIFLTCAQGWSLFYSSIGDHDPEELRGDMVCIKQGVPTNVRTGKRKYRIVDAPSMEKSHRTPKIFEKTGSYVPRCMTKVTKRTEHYSTRSDEFWLSIRFDVEEIDFETRTATQREGLVQRYSLYGSYSQFIRGLCGLIRTAPCTHRKEIDGPLALDLDAETAVGLDWSFCSDLFDENWICIGLVKGDARARWLVVYSSASTADVNNIGTQQWVLRCDGCCANCAVKFAPSWIGQGMGRRLVIL